MTGTGAVAAALVVLVAFGCLMVIVAAFIVGNENAQYPWFCPVCGEDYPCPVHGREIE